MLLISNETFEKDKQKYLDLVDSHQEQVFVEFRENKAYALTVLSEEELDDLEDEIYFSDPQIMARLEESMAQVARGETHTLTTEDLKKMVEELAEMENS